VGFYNGLPTTCYKLSIMNSMNPTSHELQATSFNYEPNRLYEPRATGYELSTAYQTKRTLTHDPRLSTLDSRLVLCYPSLITETSEKPFGRESCCVVSVCLGRA